MSICNKRWQTWDKHKYSEVPLTEVHHHLQYNYQNGILQLEMMMMIPHTTQDHSKQLRIVNATILFRNRWLRFQRRILKITALGLKNSKINFQILFQMINLVKKGCEILNYYLTNNYKNSKSGRNSRISTKY